jgi:leucyl/phenylalanyl-tRNA--protein transferase
MAARAGAVDAAAPTRWQNRGVLPWLRDTDPFPPLEHALVEPNGLIAAGATLAPGRLLDAYRRGIFPWSSEGRPLLWWSPDPRMVLYVDEFRMSRSLRKRARGATFDVRIDTACAAVIEACAQPRDDQDGTWITDGIRDAYVELHRRGHVHSVESWRDGHLVGGLYGVAMGRVFFGESMFAREADASKVALAHLVAHLQRLGVPLIDCQQETSHLATLGARPIPRAQFAAHLVELIHSAAPPAGWESGPSGGIDP